MSDERERNEELGSKRNEELGNERSPDVSEDDFEGHQLGGGLGRFEKQLEEGVVDRNEEGPGRNEEL